MKNLKFIVAVVGFTVATLGGVTKANAKPQNVRCLGDGDCGWTPTCDKINGTPTSM